MTRKAIVLDVDGTFATTWGWSPTPAREAVVQGRANCAPVVRSDVNTICFLDSGVPFN